MIKRTKSSKKARVNKTAWILDAQVHQNGIMLWMIDREGNHFQALRCHHPYFYVVFSDDASRIAWSGSEIDEKDHIRLKRRYQGILRSIQENDGVQSVQICERRVHAEDAAYRAALRVRVQSPFLFKSVINDLRELEMFEFYNTDLPIVQKFFYETGLFPFALCSLTVARKKIRTSYQYRRKKSKNGAINSKRKQNTKKKYSTFNVIERISVKDSTTKINYELPPLKVVWIDVYMESEGIARNKTDPIESFSITQDPCSEPLNLSELFHPSLVKKTKKQAIQVVINEGREVETLHMLQKAMQRIDPDVIFTNRGDESLFPYILARASHHRIASTFTLSRDKTPLAHTRFEVKGKSSFMSYGTIHHRANAQFYLNGRLHIDSSVYGGLHFEDGNLYGIVEVARVSYVPLQRLTRITIGGALQSLQFYHAHHQGVLVPEEKRNSEYFRSGSSLLFSDRGGHIVQPKVGIYKRVAELDFTSMYPSLMVEYNVSPETLNCRCCGEEATKVPGLEYHICTKRRGIVPLSINLPLKKRIAYKNLAKKLREEGNRDARKYEKMEGALKWILVVCFGYLGFRNARFGRIEAHQTVCAYAREFLLNAMKIVESKDLKVIHGIVDSLYVQAPKNMKDADFHKMCNAVSEQITQKTKIPINYTPFTDFFEVIAFLPTKANPSVGALNRYWGVKKSGGVKVRGVEIRRHDSPPFVKRFQLEAIQLVSDCMKNSEHYSLLNKQLSRHPDRTEELLSLEEKGKAGIVKQWKDMLLYKSMRLLKNYYAKLETRHINRGELIVTIRLTRRPEHYKVNNYQSIAATNLQRVGFEVGPGQKVSFIITNDGAKNASNRVVPVQLYDDKRHSYDVFKYKELLVRALTNVFPFPTCLKLKKELQNINTSLGGKKKGDGNSRLVQTTLF